jgi:hypothetical protein
MLDDLFEESRNKRYSDHYGHDPRHGGNGHYGSLLTLAQTLLRHKTLLAGIVIISLIVCVVGIWVIINMLPYLSQILGLVEKQDIKGVLDTIAPFLQKILGGEGK